MWPEQVPVTRERRTQGVCRRKSAKHQQGLPDQRGGAAEEGLPEDRKPERFLDRGTLLI